MLLYIVVRWYSVYACCLLCVVVRVCLFCRFPFCLSCIVLVLCFILATCARFCFDVRFVVSGGLNIPSIPFNRIIKIVQSYFVRALCFCLFCLNISPIALIELFYSSQSYFIVRLVFVCCAICFDVIWDKKKPTLLCVGFCCFFLID